MQNFKDNLKKISREHLIWLGLFFVLSLIVHALGRSLVNNVVSTGDAVFFGYPVKAVSSFTKYWNPYIMTGISTFLDPQYQPFYLPGVIIMAIFPNILGYNLFTIMQYTLGGYFMFLYLRSLKLKNSASVMGGIIFVFSGFIAGHKGHHAMISTAIWLPLILYFIERFVKKFEIKFLLFGGLAFGVAFTAGYPAVIMTIALITFPYLFFRMLQNAKRKELWPILKRFIFYAGVLGVETLLLSMMVILPLAESMRFINRSAVTYNFFSTYSLPLRSLTQFVFPFFYGSSSKDYFYPVTYFGQWNLTEIIGYFGILPLLLVGFGIFWLKKLNKVIYFWYGVAIIGFVLALGSTLPFVHKIMFHVPIYNMFRGAARNLFEVDFAVAVISAIAVDFIAGKQFTKKEHRRLTFSILLPVQALVLAIAGVLIPALVFRKFTPFLILNRDGLNRILSGLVLTNSEMMQAFRANVSLSSPVIYVPLATIVIAIISFVLLPKIRKSWAVWIFGTAFVFVDLFMFAHFHEVSLLNVKETLAMSPYNTVKTIDWQNPNTRVWVIESDLALGSPNTNMLSSVNSIMGMSPIVLKNYHEAVGVNGLGFVPNSRPLLRDSEKLAGLSVRYIVMSDPQLAADVSSIYPLVFQNNQFSVFEVKNCIPRLSTSVPTMKLSNTKFSNSNIKSSVISASSGRVILNDSYYPGWQVYVDGKRSSIEIVNGFAMGVNVDKGTHTVEFRFVPHSMFIGLAISTLTAAALILFGIYSHKKHLNK